MNNVILSGRICNDVEVRYLDSGMAVTTITLAVDRPKKKDGDKEADFPRINIFGKQAEALQKYSGKGKRILVEGRLRTGSYDRSGEKVYFTDVNATRVEFIDFNEKDRQNENQGDNRGYYEQRYGNNYQQQGFQPVNDEDIPF